ncbi:MAG TPA: D-2-hydroxyacid dehydrogenase [Candidatus Acidoferrum sp.]|jgi:glycerate dehydrogenase|nr:D-2-hydroxyacid dehydrogenase [Candidatus Acidoferrum sp.]
MAQPMKIIVLDGYTLNPGDLSWDELKSLGTCEVYDRLEPGEIVRFASKSEIVLTNKTELTREHLRQLPRLKYIGVLATGTNIVDLGAARELGIPVTNVPTYSTRSVAQTALALLLELTHNVGHHSHTVREGRWTRRRDFCYWDRPLIELDGLTMGIVGFGRIGGAVGELAAALGMRVLVCRPGARSLPPFARQVGLETLFRESDVVSLHCPLTPETRNLVNTERLAWMKSTAFLLNTSRGQLVDEPALAAALNSGRLAGAGLDVLSVEPPPEDNPLLSAKNCFITPHLAWATRAARSRLMQTAVANVRAFLEGKPQNVVNG